MPQHHLFLDGSPNFFLEAPVTAVAADDELHGLKYSRWKNARPVGVIINGFNPVGRRILPHRAAQAKPEIHGLKRAEGQGVLKIAEGLGHILLITSWKMKDQIRGV